MPDPVIIVGSGLAGLAAAYEALKAGAPSVHVLERASKPGGNSIKASSGINGAGTRFQKDCGITGDHDSGSALFYEDSVRSAGARLDTQSHLVDDGESGSDGDKILGETERRKSLIETLTSQSAEAVEWLTDEIGIDLSTVTQLGGHSVPRTHRGSSGPPPGFAIIGTLLKKLNNVYTEKFTLMTSATVEALLLSEDEDNDARKVKGVRYTVNGREEQCEIRGQVIMATGGFAGDAHGLLAEYRPDLAGLPSTNDDNSRGHAPSHGIKLLAAGGAALIDMDSVQVHPTGFVDPKDPDAGYKILAAEALRGEGGILLFTSGEQEVGRFVDEMTTRDVVSAAIMALPPPTSTESGEGDGNDDIVQDREKKSRQWNITLLLDPGASDAVASHLGFYISRGLMRRVRVRDLSPAVAAAVHRYATGVAAGIDADGLGRKVFGRWRLLPGDEDAEVVVGTVTPVTHFTMGGVAFDGRGRVLRRTGEAIDGVWAAGEVTGGIHGDNRLGGSSLLECVVFGRIAGREATRAGAM